MLADLSDGEQREGLLVRRVRRVAADVAAELLDDGLRVGGRLRDDEGGHALQWQAGGGFFRWDLWQVSGACPLYFLVGREQTLVASISISLIMSSQY